MSESGAESIDELGFSFERGASSNFHTCRYSVYPIVVRVVCSLAVDSIDFVYGMHLCPRSQLQTNT